MFKKFLSPFLALILAFVAFVSPVQTQAVESQFVYVEELSLDNEKSSYSVGEELKGTFVLRNAGQKDAGKIFYSILLIEVDSQRKDIKSYSIISESKYGSIDIAAKSKSNLVPFSVKIPKTAVGNKFEVRVTAQSSSGITLSWADSKSFVVMGNSPTLSVEDVFLKLSDNTTYRLQTGPVIYADKEPKDAIFKATLVNKSSSPITVHTSASLRLWPINLDAEIFNSEKVTNTIEVGGSGIVSLNLPNNNYRPGVYEGKVSFLDDKGEEILPPLDLRFTVGGEIATIHSLTSSLSAVKKNEEFKVTASVTGSPIDLSDRDLDLNKPRSQIVSLNITVLNESGTIIAEDVREADLVNENAFEFILNANKNSKALKALLTVTNKEGKLLAKFESNLSANYDSKAGAVSRNLMILILAIVACIIIAFLLLRFKKKLVALPSGASAMIIVFLIAGTIISGSFIQPRLSKAATAQALALYNTDPANGFVYDQLLSYNNDIIYEGLATDSTEHFINRTDVQTSYVVNVPIDAEYEPGDSFTISANTTYKLSGSKPKDFYVNAMADSSSRPSDSDLGIDVIPSLSTGLKVSELRDQFAAQFRARLYVEDTPLGFSIASYRLCPGATAPRDCYTSLAAAEAKQLEDIDAAVLAALTRFDTTISRYSIAPGVIKRDDEYAQSDDFVDANAVWHGTSNGTRYYDLNKTVTAPTDVGTHKFWIGSVTNLREDILSIFEYAYGAPHSGWRPGISYIDNEMFDGFGLYGFVPELYLKIKGYQEYRVIPPKPASITFDACAAGGKVMVRWTQQSDFLPAQVNSYKLYRKTSTDADYVLINGSIAGSALSYNDTLPGRTSGTVNYRIIAHHDGSNFNSHPTEGSVDLSISCAVRNGRCGTKNETVVGSGYTWPIAEELCAVGNPIPVKPTASSEVYSWRCNGVGNGALPADCRAYSVGYPACGPATSFSDWPALDAGLCRVGEMDNGSRFYNSLTGIFEWMCMVERVGEVQCAASKPDLVPATPVMTGVNGECPAVSGPTNVMKLTFKSAIGTAPATFQVYRSTSSGGTYSPIGSPVTASADVHGSLNGSYNDTTVTPGSTYWYKVSATNAIGTSAQSVASFDNSPSSCVAAVPLCGPQAGISMEYAPYTTVGLCDSGTPVPNDASAVTLNNVGGVDKWQWTCAIGVATASCEAPKVTAGDAPECGFAESESFSTAPGILHPGLCNFGTPTEPVVLGGDYVWFCKDGALSSPQCEATKLTGTRAVCGSAGAEGNVIEGDFSEITVGLCGSDSFPRNLAESGGYYRWDCSLEEGADVGISPCSAQPSVTTPLVCPADFPCPEVGEVSLDKLRTRPFLINKGAYCEVDIGRNAQVFTDRDGNTRCELKFQDVSIGPVFSPFDSTRSETVRIRKTGIEAESIFKLICYQVTVDAVTGVETKVLGVDDKVALGICKLNPRSTETSLLKRIFIGTESLSASIWEAFAKFFNLK